MPRDDPHTRLLWGFDEYFLGYKDRSIVANTEDHGQLFTMNGIFFPLILQDGKVIGSWKREYKKDRVIIRPEILSWHMIDMKELEKECERYTKFSGYREFEIQYS